MVHRGLRGVIVALLLRFVDDETGHRADVHNGTRLRIEHVLAKGTAAPERAVEIDVDDVQPMLVCYHFRRCFASCNGGIVDQDIDSSMLRRNLIRHFGDAPGIRHVHHHDLGIAAFRPEAGASAPGHIRIPVGDDDLRTRFPERFRACEADPLPGAGDDGDAAAKSKFLQIHLVPVPVY